MNVIKRMKLLARIKELSTIKKIADDAMIEAQTPELELEPGLETLLNQEEIDYGMQVANNIFSQLLEELPQIVEEELATKLTE